MRLSYLCLDRPDSSFALNCLSPRMKRPTTKDHEELKRLGRHLRGRPVGSIIFEPHNIASSFGSVLRRRQRWRLGETQIAFWNGGHVEVTRDQA